MGITLIILGPIIGAYIAGIITLYKLRNYRARPAVCKTYAKIHELERAEFGGILTICDNQNCQVCNPKPPSGPSGITKRI